MAARALLACGFIASVLYLAMNVFVPLGWPEYSSFSQTISELSAVDAPTRPLWFPLGILYTLLVAAFGAGIWRFAGHSRRLRLVGGLFVVNGLIGLGWMPMHQRVVLAAGGATITDTLHIVWAVVTVVLMLCQLGIAAPAFGPRFRAYTLATIVVLFVFGALTFQGSPGVAANLPTPWLGVYERINVLGFMLWQGVLSVTLLRVRHPAPATAEDADPLLDQFMPRYDVAERHHIGVAAPAGITFAAACEHDLMRSPLIRAVFRMREIALGSARAATTHPRGLLAYTTSLGWGVLADVPGREVVMGAVTQPWNANVVFRALPPGAFAAFDEPGYVKIAWTLRADPTGPGESTFRHETRVCATDAVARARFRRYWSVFSPGIKLIRLLMLEPLRKDAEGRARRADRVASTR